MAADPTVQVVLAGMDGLITEARKRFDRCAEWEAQWRQRFLEDMKFRFGDSDNGWQWPNAIRLAREGDAKPCLTINNIRQHNLQIVNDAKQNKSSVKIAPKGNGATKEGADVWMALIRDIEYRSNAQDAYTNAIAFQVDGGRGAWRLKTAYAGPDTFDQEILIEPVNDPLAIYIDPDCKQRDKSDALFAFVFEILPDDDFKELYPKYKDLAGLPPLSISTVGDTRLPKNYTLVCEYFRKVSEPDVLIEFWAKDQNRLMTVRKSMVPANVWSGLQSLDRTRTRDTTVDKVEWYLMVGDQIVDKTTWAGKYIPLLIVAGEENFVSGVFDSPGHTRAMKDAQRMYNYNASGQVEFGALQTKSPWVVPAKAIEEYESIWNTANTVNHSALPYQHMDDDGNPIPPPQRAQPPVPSQLYQLGMDTAFNQLMMASGQWQNQMGMMGNERTGEAIKRRQHQSDTAVYHYQDAYESALRFCGKQLIDLIPRIYDTKRVMTLTSEEGTDFELEVDPGAAQAYSQVLDRQNQIVKRVLNPQLGKYDVEATVGPAYGTRRQETVEAMTLILTQAPGLTGIIGDLLLRAMDFKEAKEAAERLRRMVPPQALGTGPTQAEQALQQQVQGLQGALSKALERMGKEQLKLAGKDQMREIDAYAAVTNRLKVLLDHGVATQGLSQDMASDIYDLVLRANEMAQGNGNGTDNGTGNGAQPPAPAPAPAPPYPGARQANDGQWYILDPTRKGKYLRIAPLAQERRVPGVIGNA